MTAGIALLARVMVPWRAMVLAALLSLSIGAALSLSLGGAPRSGTPGAGVREDALSSLPLEAQGAVSAKLGAEAPAYHLGAFRGGVAHAFNPAQRLHLRFAHSGVQVSSAGVRMGITLSAIGRGSSLAPVQAVAPTAAVNRVLYAHSAVSEWYVNGPLGLEQGFTLSHSPSQRSAGPLTLSLAISGGARASLAADRQSIAFTRPGGSSLGYGGLLATDARGRTLHGWMELRSGRALLRVEDRGASYPLRIDPLVQEGNKLTGSEEVGPGMLGYSVALSADGNTALIGAKNDDSLAGAVWVFTRSGGVWAQQGPKLTGAETGGVKGEPCGETGGEEANECAFGRSVSLSGDGNVALVGAPREAGPCPTASEPSRMCESQGAAWVFTRSGTIWSRQTALSGGSEEGTEGRFGRSVSLSPDGSTALVGAPNDRGGAGGAWVFKLTGSSWAQQGPKLEGEGEVGEGHLGVSVSLSGDGATALVGGPGDSSQSGAAWLFTRSGSTWTQHGGKLTGGEEAGAALFGFSVAMSADAGTALVGGRADETHRGAAWAFTAASSTWAQQGPKLTGGEEEAGGGAFGSSLALSADGNMALIGAPQDGGMAGAAWVLTRSGSSWSHEGSKLTPVTAMGGAARKGSFGSSVALRADGATALIGSPTDAEKVGAVWVYADPAILPAVEGLSPAFGPAAGGTSVKITGSRLAGASRVEFGATPTTFTVNSDGSITAIAPPQPAGTGHEGKVYVTVTTPEGISPFGPAAQFTYLSPGSTTTGTVLGSSSAGSGSSGAGATGGVLGFGPLCKPALLSRSIAVLSRSRAAVKLIWRGAGSCGGKLRLNVRIKVGRRFKTKTIAATGFTIAAGRARTITIKLNSTGRALLSKGHGRLSANLTITSLSSGHTQAQTAKVRLALVKAKARRK